MDRASLDGIELAYELRGVGEPVVLVHHGAGVDWFEPLSEEPALAGSFRILRSHRVGYGSSSPSAGPLDFREDAAHCRALLRHLGLERAHVVGHSSSAMIALQLALDAPDAVQTLSLLESARPAPQNERQAEFVSSVLTPALERYTAGDKAGAIDAWLQGVCGPDYRAALERALPDAFEQALADADRYFGQELPAVQRWPFTEADAGRVTQPAWSSSARRAVRSSTNARSCSSIGSRTPSPTSSRRHRTSSPFRTRETWPAPWPASSRAIRSRPPGGRARCAIGRPRRGAGPTRRRSTRPRSRPSRRGRGAPRQGPRGPQPLPRLPSAPRSCADAAPPPRATPGSDDRPLSLRNSAQVQTQVVPQLGYPTVVMYMM